MHQTCLFCLFAETNECLDLTKNKGKNHFGKQKLSCVFSRLQNKLLLDGDKSFTFKQEY